MRSDIWQFIVLVASLCLLLCCLSQYNEALAAIAAIKFEIVNDKFEFSRLRYFLLVIGSGFLVGPTLFVCLLSAKSPKAAERGTLIAIPGLALTAFLITIVGVACASIADPGTSSESALSNILETRLRPWVKICVSLGLYSAIISSADSCLMTAAAICANDLIKRPGILPARASMLLISIGSLILALRGQGILALLLMAYDIFVCGIVSPVFFAIIFPEAAKRSRKFFFCALLGGAAFGVASAVSGDSTWSLAGLSLSAVISLLGVLAGKLKIALTPNPVK